MASGIAQIRKSVLTLALPVTVSTLLQRTEGIAAVFLVGGLGATSIAAVGLGQLLAFIATTLVSGLSVGANVLIAQLWGARRTKDVGEAATHLLGLAAIVSCSLVALGLSLNRIIMELLGAEHDVIALALPYSNFIFLVIPCTIFLQVLSSIIQGTGDTKTPMYALIAVNLLYLTIAYPLIYGLWGVPRLGYHRSSCSSRSRGRDGRGLPPLVFPNALEEITPRATRSLALYLANWSVGFR